MLNIPDCAHIQLYEYRNTLLHNLRSWNNSVLTSYACPSEYYVTDALVSLHWLRVPDRIQFKIAVLTYRVLHGDVP